MVHPPVARPSPPLTVQSIDRDQSLLLWFEEVGRTDTELVGGKGASLGELFRKLTPKGVPVPNGFMTTALAYRVFLDAPSTVGVWDEVADAEGLPRLCGEVIRSNTLRAALHACFQGANTSDHLEMHSRTSLARDLVERSMVPGRIEEEILGAYERLCGQYGADVDVAVRSSATVEDLALGTTGVTAQ